MVTLNRGSRVTIKATGIKGKVVCWRGSFVLVRHTDDGSEQFYRPEDVVKGW